MFNTMKKWWRVRRLRVALRHLDREIVSMQEYIEECRIRRRPGNWYANFLDGIEEPSSEYMSELRTELAEAERDRAEVRRQLRTFGHPIAA